jgi:hypothetical protein
MKPRPVLSAALALLMLAGCHAKADPQDEDAPRALPVGLPDLA